MIYVTMYRYMVTRNFNLNNMRIEEITIKNVWEDFINKHSPQSLFQSWNWGETINKIKNQKSNIKNLYRLGLYEDDNLLGIAQVVYIDAKRGAFLHVRHGPIFKEWRKDYFDILLNYLKNLSRRENAVFIRISPQLPDSIDNKSFFRDYKFYDAPIHRMDGEICWVLDLTKSEIELLSGMRKTTRYLIRQAQKLDIKIVKSQNKEDIDEFLRLYNDTASRQHFVKHPGIKEEFDQFVKDDQILLFKGYYKSDLLAAALIIFYNDQAIYHHSASIQQKIPVNYLLQWEVIKEAKKRSKQIYNLWGISPEDNHRHPWQGLTLFKKGFGGYKVEYLHSKDLPLSFLYCATYIIEQARKLLKGY